MAYEPKVGDRVDAHSKGFTDDDHAAVYTDWAWYPGKITKVKIPPPVPPHMIECILYYDARIVTNNVCLGNQKRNAIKTSIFL